MDNSSQPKGDRPEGSGVPIFLMMPPSQEALVRPWPAAGPRKGRAIDAILGAVRARATARGGDADIAASGEVVEAANPVPAPQRPRSRLTAQPQAQTRDSQPPTDAAPAAPAALPGVLPEDPSAVSGPPST